MFSTELYWPVIKQWRLTGFSGTNILEIDNYFTWVIILYNIALSYGHLCLSVTNIQKDTKEIGKLWKNTPLEDQMS